MYIHTYLYIIHAKNVGIIGILAYPKIAKELQILV